MTKFGISPQTVKSGGFAVCRHRTTGWRLTAAFLEELTGALEAPPLIARRACRDMFG
jgi:hypothetical protein